MNDVTHVPLKDFSLDDRYRVERGGVYLNGVQALLRILLDQRRADVRRGLNTGGFVCGYPGSPVGGVDGELERNAALLSEHHVVHRFGLNEELAATAVAGSQLLHEAPGARYDGVFGLWFGKAPGVDRAADAFRHANFRGVGRNGGVLAVAGDDPHARSTIFPSDSNGVFSSLYMPTLCPGSVQDVVDFGLHGYALSRASGLWVGLKLVNDVADSAGTVLVDPARIAPIAPEVQFDGELLAPRMRVNATGPALVEAERRIVHGQHEIARQYARANGLNRITFDPKRPRFGIAAVGKNYFDLRQALRDLRIDDAALETAGVRLLKIGMIYPIEPSIVRAFAAGLEEILVVEDKRPVLEAAIKDILYGTASPPRVLGKTDESGAPLLSAHGELSADEIARVLARRLDARLPSLALAERVASLERPAAPTRPPAARTAYFCSGCPHNRSLRVPEGAVVGAGIGCHIMTLSMSRVFGEVVGFTQMGGEGAQWVGLAPFSDTGHFFQNLGDGTFAHSGSLALRFAVSAGINVTYKILYNSTVAMTGGQDIAGGLAVPAMVKMLQAEGAARIAITTDEPERYKGVDVSGAQVRHRDDLVEVERELAATPGVTVLIHDQQCAAEKRRGRKRGTIAVKPQTVVISERVCEGCGDCGQKSNCLSVQPAETEFGRKTRIHQSSCNQDFSCLLGDCPSFMTVETTAPRSKPRRAAARALPADIVLPEPREIVPSDDFCAVLVGIGGTGVVTVNQVLGTAANIAGLHAQTYDHTGSAQKAGPVISHLKVSQAPIAGAPTVSGARADLYLVFDPLGAVSPDNLLMTAPGRTVAVVSTAKVPTGQMVSNPKRSYPSLAALTERINAATRPDENLFLDAQSLAERLLGDHMASNLLLVGAAYQRGALPIPAEAIERAIRLNATQVDMNLAAFRWGRFWAADPERVGNLAGAAGREKAGAPRAVEKLSERAARIVDSVGAKGELKRLLSIRAPELIAYQDEAYAASYARMVARAREIESRVAGGRAAFSEAVARNLYKLMAYKDEYEVARLLLAAEAERRASLGAGTNVRISFHLHPTFLRTLGVKKKVKLGPWFKPGFAALKALKAARGSPLDLFGRTQVRRIERALLTHYRALLEALFATLSAETYDLAVELAQAPDLVRGYEEVKLANVSRYRTEVERLAGLLSLEVPFGPEVAALPLSDAQPARAPGSLRPHPSQI
jgi:indolepyruvate ferredoxin oxidoreductase